MELTDRAARVGTAGFVLARLLLEPPSQALAANFGDPAMRDTWPLRDATTAAALDPLGPDPYEDLVRDHARLFRNRPSQVPPLVSAWRRDGTDPARLRAELVAWYAQAGLHPVPTDDHIGHQLALLAHLATRLGPAPSGRMTPQVAAADALTFRTTHLDPVVAPVLDGIARHARTRLYRAVPGLVRGFLAEHRALCTTVLDHR